jgi:hypothetical protein
MNPTSRSYKNDDGVPCRMARLQIMSISAQNSCLQKDSVHRSWMQVRSGKVAP